MGANSSKQTHEQLTNIINTQMNKSITTIENSTTNEAWALQRINIDLRNANLEGCDLSVRQEQAVKVAVLQESSVDISTELANDLQNKLITEIDQQLDQANEGINLGQINISQTKSSVKTYIENHLENIIETTIQNTVKQKSSSEQILDFDGRNLRCRNGKIDITQSALLEATASNISDNIIDQIAKNTGLNDVITVAEQSVSQSNTGVTTGMILAAALLVGLLIIGYVLIKSGGKGGKLPPGAMQQMAAAQQMQQPAFVPPPQPIQPMQPMQQPMPYPMPNKQMQTVALASQLANTYAQTRQPAYAPRRMPPPQPVRYAARAAGGGANPLDGVSSLVQTLMGGANPLVQTLMGGANPIIETLMSGGKDGSPGMAGLVFYVVIGFVFLLVLVMLRESGRIAAAKNLGIGGGIAMIILSLGLAAYYRNNKGVMGLLLAMCIPFIVIIVFFHRLLVIDVKFAGAARPGSTPPAGTPPAETP